MCPRELSSCGGEVEDVYGGLAFGVDEGDVDVAGLVRENGADAVQEPGPVLRDDLDQGAMR